MPTRVKIANYSKNTQIFRLPDRKKRQSQELSLRELKIHYISLWEMKPLQLKKQKLNKVFTHFWKQCTLRLVKNLKNSVSRKFLYLNQNSVSVKIVCHGAASRRVLLYLRALNQLLIKLKVQQNPVGSDPVESKPPWEVILNSKKKFEISDFTRFLSDFT